MFDHTHYIPILRWKRGERIALRNLLPSDKIKMTPLIELVPKDFKPKKQGDIVDTDKVLHDKAEEISINWGPAPFFLDLWYLNTTFLTSHGLHPFEVLDREVRSCQLSLFNATGPLIPVTGLDRPANYQSAVATLASTDQRGACLRLFLKDIQRSSFKNDLEVLLSVLNLQLEQIDLLIDYQVSNESNPSIASLLGRLPDLHRWRTFTAARGAFTRDLSGFKKNRQHVLPRMDWRVWHREVTDPSQPLPRQPSYSDYTIQHAIYSEPQGLLNISASIRYTAGDYWVIMRGEGLRNADGPGYAQYPANALLLTERNEFCGADFSYGDEYIRDIALQNKKTGSPETWLRAGINHHLTFVVRQIATLFDL